MKYVKTMIGGHEAFIHVDSLSGRELENMYPDLVEHWREFAELGESLGEDMSDLRAAAEIYSRGGIEALRKVSSDPSPAPAGCT